MALDIPYFMQNPDWYYHDDKEGIYKLTDKAPEEARKSYKDFYYDLNEAHLIIEEPLTKEIISRDKATGEVL